MMPLEKQVCSLEISKELKEAGYPQEGLWWWFLKPHAHFQYSVGKRFEYVDWKDGRNVCVAPTVAELGMALPGILEDGMQFSMEKHEELDKAEPWYCVYEDGLSVSMEKYADTEANARAKMWLYLKKEGLL